MKGKELIVKALRAEGVSMVFGYPGGQAVDIFDALYDVQDIELILPRHEQALIHAADGYARSTGKTGVCIVTSGPGATNLVTGIATAKYDSVPLVCITGQVPRDLMGKDAFQEVDIVSITKSISKSAVTVKSREALAETLQEAFYTAAAGRPGPVVVDVPKDIQLADGSGEYVSKAAAYSGRQLNEMDRKQLKKAADALTRAKRPLILAGGGVNLSDADAQMLALAEKTGIPVVTTIMGRGAVPTDHPCYLGNLGIHGSYAANHAVMACDVLCAVGTRFNDRVTNHTDAFAQDAVIIHIDLDETSINKNVHADLPVVADAGAALTVLCKETLAPQIDAWIAQVTAWREAYPVQMEQYQGLTPEKLIRYINEHIKDPIVTTDVGQNQLWATQYIALNGNRRFLTSGGLGTMGYGFPAAIGAQLGNPDRTVIAISGDGGIQMNIQELATAVAYGLPLIVLILNNGYLGNVRQWQEMFYRKHYVGTCLTYRKGCQKNCANPNKDCPKYIPDFVKLAQSYDAYGIRITKEEEIEQAFAYAAEHKDAPTVVECIIEREANVYPLVPTGSRIDQMIRG